MADLKERIAAELDNIRRIFPKLPEEKDLSNLSALELAGVAALIHSFYNGVENILKQIVKEKGKALPQGQTWHRDLVELALNMNVISEQTSKALKPYLAFRHFFSHAYAFDLYPERIDPLVQGMEELFENLCRDMEEAYKKL